MNPEEIKTSSLPKQIKEVAFSVALQKAIPPKGILFSYSEKELFPSLAT